MRPRSFLLVVAVAACGCGGDRVENRAAEDIAGPANAWQPGQSRDEARWDAAASGEGTALFFANGGGGRALTLFCPAGSSDLLVNVAAFRPVGSEERMSFGSGGTAIALVADPAGDRGRGGVSAAGPLPAELRAILAGPISVNYGAQNAGPFAAPPPELAGNFLAGCRGRAAAPPAPAPKAAHPCEMQDGERLSVTPLRAIGTEPFWGARIQGRCVTYSHPEDQQGTRVWTRYAEQPGGGRWTGTLDRRRFELVTRAQPGCSDGMSDRRYPIAVELQVGGERRHGCAEPL